MTQKPGSLETLRALAEHDEFVPHIDSVLTLCAELARLRADHIRHEAALDFIWSWAHCLTFMCSRDNESGSVTFGLFHRGAQKIIAKGCDTPLQAIEAAMKEETQCD